MQYDIQNKAIGIEDLQGLFDLINKNADHFIDYFPITVSDCATISKAEIYLQSLLDEVKKQELILWGMYDGGSLIGLIFVKHIDWRIPKGELAYLIDKSYTRKGISTSQLQKVIDHCFTELKFHKLLCRVSPKNEASIKLALRCGFKLEGILRGEFRVSNGSIEDIAYYGKLANTPNI